MRQNSMYEFAAFFVYNLQLFNCIEFFYVMVDL